MKRFMMLFGLAILLAAAPKALTAQGGFVVIANEASGVQELSADDVSRMFFKRTTQWPNGQVIVPVDLPVRARTRATFSQAVHGKSVSAVTAYWNRQIFSGRGVPPVERSSEQEVVTFVRSTPNAIGYVSVGTSLGSGVKEVRISNK